MHFFPFSGTSEQLHVQTLIAVVFGGVDIVEYAAGLLFEYVSDEGIYLKALSLFGQFALGFVEYYAYKMAVLYMVEV